jgi:phosphoribosylanthranilate isomerase
MRVKVCGITNLEDALSCYTEGAHALGFIFAKESPRFITLDECKQITKQLPPFCERIGVFVDEKIQKIVEIVEACNLTAIQLHGKTEDNNYITKLRELSNKPIIRAFRLNTKEDCQQITFLNQKLLQAILIDGPGKKLVNKEVINEVQTLTNLPIILAGALNEENIEECLQNTKPIALDICSGLESVPGKKDLTKVKAFFCKLKHLEV